MQTDEYTSDGTPLIAVRMSEKAAERLSRACREAYNAVLDELETEGRKPRKREEEMLEMLDWASRWLVISYARVPVPLTAQRSITRSIDPV